jgi:FMN-dependent NADH-azoreductase
MSTLLQINASLNGESGQSSQLAAKFVERWREQNPQGHVITRDLAAQPAPHLTAARFQAFFAPPEALTEEQREAAAYSDALIDELKAADVLVFGVPMYNFSVPSTLRSYFDHVARAGVTFRYSANGAEGLLKGKKAYIFIARGGVYTDATDTQTPYLRQFLGLVGIADIEFIYAEGLAFGEESKEKGLAAARHAIAKLAAERLAA